MDVYDVIKKSNNAHGANTPKDSSLYELRRALSRGFHRALDIEIAEHNGNRFEAILADGKDYQNKKIVSLDYAIPFGATISCYDADWIVTEIDRNQHLYCRGKIQRCNYVLRFINASGEVDSRPCIIENYTKYNSGIMEDKVMVLPSSQYAVKMTLDSETVRLNRDRRFLIDINQTEPQAFVLTQPDRMTYVENGTGYVVLTLNQSERTQNDNVELMIADYHNYPAKRSVRDISISFSGKPVLEVGKGYKLFRVSTVDGLATDSLEDMVWTVRASSPQLDQFIDYQVCKDGIKIKATHAMLFGHPVCLTLSDVAGSIIDELTLEVMLIG